MDTKEISVKDVMQYVPDQAQIATTTYGLGGMPEELLKELGAYYKEHQHPKDVTLMAVAGMSRGEGTGMDYLLEPGLLKRFIGTHMSGAPLSAKAALANQYELYMLPQGIIGKLYRDAAAKGPGVWSKVGIGTFVDPRQEGGRINDRAKAAEELVEVTKVNGEEWLYFKPLPINVTFIKATYADPKGNLSFIHEPLKLEALTLAMAAKNAGGIVIAQVEDVVATGTLPAKEVDVPGVLVDYVVKAKPEYHQQTFMTQYSPLLSNEIRTPKVKSRELPLDNKTVIARRAVRELKPNSFINIGVGMADKVSRLINEADLLDQFTLNTDLGAIGGMTASDYNYGTNYNADAIINTLDMFDYYHGGGVDTTVLGFGQMDANGNMNTTQIGEMLIGPGGMIDISASASKIIFIGTFTVKGETSVENGQLVINHAGVDKKFKSDLSYITFSSKEAIANGKEIIIVTDRAVFEINKDSKLVLIEMAQGLDLEKDILDWMEFEPLISDKLKEIDSSYYSESWNLKDYISN